MYKISIPLGVFVSIVAITAYMFHAGTSFAAAVEFFSGTFIFTLVGVLVAFSILVSFFYSWHKNDFEQALREF